MGGRGEVDPGLFWDLGLQNHLESLIYGIGEERSVNLVFFLFVCFFTLKSYSSI